MLLGSWPPECQGGGVSGRREQGVSHGCALRTVSRGRMCVCVLSHVQLFVTPWTAAHQAPLSVGSSRQECWSGLPLPAPRDLPTQGSNPHLLCLLHWQARFFTTEPLGKLKKSTFLQATVYQIARIGHDLAIKPPPPPQVGTGIEPKNLMLFATLSNQPTSQLICRYPQALSRG